VQSYEMKDLLQMYVIEEKDLDALDAAGALAFAKVCAAGADNLGVVLASMDRQTAGSGALARGATVVEILQHQAKIWCEIYDRLLTAELRSAADAQVKAYYASETKTETEDRPQPVTLQEFDG
jgi:hypothetical protein